MGQSIGGSLYILLRIMNSASVAEVLRLTCRSESECNTPNNAGWTARRNCSVKLQVLGKTPASQQSAATPLSAASKLTPQQTVIR